MDLSLDFRRASTELSMHFWRAYKKYNVSLSKVVGKDRIILGLAWLLLGISLGLRPREISQRSLASLWKTPSVPLLLMRLIHSQ